MSLKWTARDRSALAPVVFLLLAVAAGPAAAQACKCPPPSGFTTVPEKAGQRCVIKSVKCVCEGVKSTQPKCVYPVIPGGGSYHADVPPPTAAGGH